MEGGVREHPEGRKPFLPGDIEAQRPQLLEESRVGRGRFAVGRCGVAGRFVRGRRLRTGQGDGLPVAEKRPPRGGQGHGREPAVAGAAEQVSGDEFVRGVPQILLPMIACDAVDAQPVVPEFQHPLRPRAAQHRHDVGHAETLSGTDHPGEDFLGDLGSVVLLDLPAGSGSQTDVAAPAIFQSLKRGVREVVEQVASPAGGEFAVGDHPGEPVLRALAFGGVFDLADEPLLGGPVGDAEEQDAFARKAVASGAPGLLVVALYRLREVVVRNEAQVGHVNPHPERDRGRDDQRLLAGEPVLRRPALLVVESGVVGQSAETQRAEPLGHRFRLPPREAVHDCGLPLVFPQESDEKVEGAPFGSHPVVEVGTIEAAHEELGILHPEFGGDFPADPLGGGRGERQEGGRREAVAQRSQLPVVRPELMTPLGDAVGLVHRHQPHPDPFEEPPEARGGETLRRYVEQLYLAGLRLLADEPRLFGAERTVEAAGGDPPRPERIHLVLHQGDQGRDDQGDAVEGERRKLVAKRFAPASGHQHHCVAPGQDAGDRRFLQRSEALVAEVFLQQGKRKGLCRPGLWCALHSAPGSLPDRARRMAQAAAWSAFVVVRSRRGDSVPEPGACRRMVGAAHSSGGLNPLGASFWSRAERLRCGTLDGNATALAFPGAVPGS